MEPELDRRRPDTFVVQIAPSAGGDLAGLVHHLRTGRKRRFEGLEDLGAAIRGMAHGDATDTGPKSG